MIGKARFGRGCFIAGWLSAAILSAAWRAWDWPDWVGVPVLFVVGLASFHLIDRAAERGERRRTQAQP